MTLFFSLFPFVLPSVSGKQLVFACIPNSVTDEICVMYLRLYLISLAVASKASHHLWIINRRDEL